MAAVGGNFLRTFVIGGGDCRRCLLLMVVVDSLAVVLTVVFCFSAHSSLATQSSIDATPTLPRPPSLGSAHLPSACMTPRLSVGHLEKSGGVALVFCARGQRRLEFNGYHVTSPSISISFCVKKSVE
ncbi:unnamed protein product, partial [Ectocarpus sp. 12 AP-2014]